MWKLTVLEERRKFLVNSGILQQKHVQASSRKGGKQKPTNNTTLHLKDNLEVEYPVLSGPLRRIFFFLNLHILVLRLLLIPPAQIPRNLSFQKYLAASGVSCPTHTPCLF